MDNEREIIIPVTVRVGGREMEVPITVSAGLDDLVQVVVEHLNTGTDVRELLVAHYARRYYGEMGDEPAPAEEAAPVEEPPAPEPRNGRRKGGELPGFPDEELEQVDLDAPPPYPGRGKKSRQRLLWEAAMRRAGREV